jgi:uncharacterized oligopeptide transporter (OPT) family protein
MDLQALIVFVGGFAFVAVVGYIVTIFGAKEQVATGWQGQLGIFGAQHVVGLSGNQGFALIQDCQEAWLK